MLNNDNMNHVLGFHLSGTCHSRERECWQDMQDLSLLVLFQGGGEQGLPKGAGFEGQLLGLADPKPPGPLFSPILVSILHFHLYEGLFSSDKMFIYFSLKSFILFHK